MFIVALTADSAATLLLLLILMLLLLLPLLLLPAADAAADAAGGGFMLSMQEVGCYKDNRQSRILSLGYTSLKDNSAEVRIYFRSSAFKQCVNLTVSMLTGLTTCIDGKNIDPATRGIYNTLSTCYCIPVGLSVAVLALLEPQSRFR